MDHATGFLANGSLINPQTAPMLASKFDHYDPHLVENLSTAEQSSIICNMLVAKASQAQIFVFVQTYKAMKKAGILRMVGKLSELPTEQLLQMIHAKEPCLPPAVKVYANLKRKMSEDSAEGLASSPQNVERPRKTLKGEKPIQPKPSKNRWRVMPSGCPGDGDMCPENKSRRWRSKKRFLVHFETKHPEEYKSIDCFGGSIGFKCLECEKRNLFFSVSSGVFTSAHIQNLAVHVWHDHMIPRTAIVHPKTGEVGMRDALEEPSDMRREETGGAEIGDQLRSFVTTERLEVKPGVPSGTQHSQTSSDAELDIFSASDIFKESNAAGEFDFDINPVDWEFLYLKEYFGGPAFDV